MKLLFPLFLLTVLAVGCKKNDLAAEDDYLTLRYDQTQCADRWAYGTSDTQQKTIVANYLDSIGLFASSVDISLESPELNCSACTCKTGKIIVVNTFDLDSIRIRYQALGFR